MEQEKILQELQAIEHHLQHYVAQKQSFQSQLLEINSALSELSKNNDTYKIIGNIMVKSDPITLKNEIQEKKDILELRLNSIRNEEVKLKEKAEKLQIKIKGD